MEPTGIRLDLEKRLRGPVTDELWNYLSRLGFVDELENGRLTAEDLAHEAREIIRAGAPNRRPERAGEIGRPAEKGQEHAWALSVVVADGARNDREVVSYRRDVLLDTLMEWSDVPSWIKAQAASGVPLKLLTVIDNRTKDYDERTVDLRQVTVVNREAPVLKYAAPGDSWTQVVPTTSGPLERLRILSETLAKFYGWTEPQATVFVLTDAVPLISPMRSTSGGYLMRNGYSMDWAVRITLTIDPSVPAEEVADAYRKVRRDARQDGRRRLSAKHAMLAVFRVEHDALSWSQLLDAWNVEHPDWRYEYESNFRRDALRAGARLLYPDRYHGQRPLRAS